MIIYEIDGVADQTDDNIIKCILVQKYKRVDECELKDDTCIYTLRKNGMCLFNDNIYINIEHLYNKENIYSKLFIAIKDELITLIRDDKINNIFIK